MPCGSPPAPHTPCPALHADPAASPRSVARRGRAVQRNRSGRAQLNGPAAAPRAPRPARRRRSCCRPAPCVMTRAPNAEALAARLVQPRAERGAAGARSPPGASGAQPPIQLRRAGRAGGRAERGTARRGTAGGCGCLPGPASREGGSPAWERDGGGDRGGGHGDPRQPGVLRAGEQDQDEEEALRSAESEAVSGQRSAAQRPDVGGKPLGKGSGCGSGLFSPPPPLPPRSLLLQLLPGVELERGPGPPGARPPELPSCRGASAPPSSGARPLHPAARAPRGPPLDLGPDAGRGNPFCL